MTVMLALALVTLMLESALLKVFGVQLYKNNMCMLLSRILSIVKSDRVAAACAYSTQIRKSTLVLDNLAMADRKDNTIG